MSSCFKAFGNNGIYSGFLCFKGKLNAAYYMYNGYTFLFKK